AYVAGRAYRWASTDFVAMLGSEPGNCSFRCWSNHGAALFSDAGTCCQATRLAHSHSVGNSASTLGTWKSNPSSVLIVRVSAVGVRFSRDAVRALSHVSTTFRDAGASNWTSTDRSEPFFESIHQWASGSVWTGISLPDSSSTR